MTSAGSYKLRFYEKEPSVKFAIELLFAFPESLQSIIGRGFSRIAEKEYKAGELIQDLKTLGKETVLALHQSKTRRRSYDRIPTVHRAMTYLRVLSSEDQKSLASQGVELMGFMQNYLELCRDYQTVPRKEVFDSISDAYVQQGSASAKMLVNALHVEYDRKKHASPAKEMVYGESIKDEKAGMRIHRNRD